MDKTASISVIILYWDLKGTLAYSLSLFSFLLSEGCTLQLRLAWYIAIFVPLPPEPSDYSSKPPAW